MKKSIEIIKINPSVTQWILDSLEHAEGDAAEELCRGLSDLQEGNTSSLLLEKDESEPASVFSSEMKFGNLKIQIAARRVTEGGREINLTPKEFDILCFLAGHSGQVFTKEQIYRAVWETSYCLDDSNIMAFIRKLRKKIEPDPDSPVYILTVWGIGYKFNDRIE